MREFPDRARGRRRPRSVGGEENEHEGRRRDRLRHGNFLIVLVIVVVLGLPAVKKTRTKAD
jgi:hypothetical protein